MCYENIIRHSTIIKYCVPMLENLEGYNGWDIFFPKGLQIGLPDNTQDAQLNFRQIMNIVQYKYALNFTWGILILKNYSFFLPDIYT